MVTDLGLESIHTSVSLRERFRFVPRGNLNRSFFVGLNRRKLAVLAGFLALGVSVAWFGPAVLGSTPAAEDDKHRQVPLLESANIGQESVSDIDINLKSSSRTSTGGSSHTSSSTSLRVNGQDIPVEGGNVQRHIVSDDGDTTIDISIQNSSSAGGEDM